MSLPVRFFWRASAKARLNDASRCPLLSGRHFYFRFIVYTVARGVYPPETYANDKCSEHGDCRPGYICSVFCRFSKDQQCFDIDSVVLQDAGSVINICQVSEKYSGVHKIYLCAKV